MCYWWLKLKIESDVEWLLSDRQVIIAWPSTHYRVMVTWQQLTTQDGELMDNQQATLSAINSDQSLTHKILQVVKIV